jgi:hypothetical protein
MTHGVLTETSLVSGCRLDWCFVNMALHSFVFRKQNRLIPQWGLTGLSTVMWTWLVGCQRVSPNDVLHEFPIDLFLRACCFSAPGQTRFAFHLSLLYPFTLRRPTILSCSHSTALTEVFGRAMRKSFAMHPTTGAADMIECHLPERGRDANWDRFSHAHSTGHLTSHSVEINCQ